jgi:hypothetical protein
MSDPEDKPEDRLAKQGVQSRRARLVEEYSGGWASSSQDFVYLAADLYAQSVSHAKKFDGNVSPYGLAGIPMLVAATRAFLVELYSGIFTGEINQSALKLLGSLKSEVDILREIEQLPAELLTDLDLLMQIRHEILHPAHRPGPERDGAPDYLRRLKQDGLLQSTGKDQDYTWISQLQSHQLFRWSFATVASLVDSLITAHEFHEFSALGLRHSYFQFQTLDAA